MKTGDYQLEEHKTHKRIIPRGVDRRITEEETYNFQSKVVTERQMPASVIRKKAKDRLHF